MKQELKVTLTIESDVNTDKGSIEKTILNALKNTFYKLAGQLA